MNTHFLNLSKWGTIDEGMGEVAHPQLFQYLSWDKIPLFPKYFVEGMIHRLPRYWWEALTYFSKDEIEKIDEALFRLKGKGIKAPKRIYPIQAKKLGFAPELAKQYNKYRGVLSKRRRKRKSAQKRKKVKKAVKAAAIVVGTAVLAAGGAAFAALSPATIAAISATSEVAKPLIQRAVQKKLQKKALHEAEKAALLELPPEAYNELMASIEGERKKIEAEKQALQQHGIPTPSLPARSYSGQVKYPSGEMYKKFTEIPSEKKVKMPKYTIPIAASIFAIGFLIMRRE
ncbi:MAG: hypothetical protein U9N14_06155 [Pseudomonadota bacterium]|nr:hypothetical protein [Pseudomonadota bacterium]